MFISSLYYELKELSELLCTQLSISILLLQTKLYAKMHKINMPIFVIAESNKKTNYMTCQEILHNIVCTIRLN